LGRGFHYKVIISYNYEGAFVSPETNLRMKKWSKEHLFPGHFMKLALSTLPEKLIMR